MIAVPFAILVVLIVIGMPIGFALLVAAVATLYTLGLAPITFIPDVLEDSVQHFTLLAIPFFLLAAELLTAGGLIDRIFDLARALVGRPWNAVLLIAFVVAMFWHATLGLQVVIEDYVHTRWKEVSLLVLVKFLAVLGALASVLAVLRIALGA